MACRTGGSRAGPRRLWHPGPFPVAMRALALLAALLLAGCTAPMERFFSDGEVSDDEVRDEADEAARAWKADAAFAGAFAFEAREGPYALGATPTADPDVGNGEAVAWAFTYLSSGRMATFVVNASGTVALQDESDAPEDDFAAVTGQEVDSDEAVETARDDGRVVEAIGKAKAIGIALGDNGTSGPVWTMFTIGGSPGIVAIVDARTGALMSVHEWSMPSFGDWGDWGMGDWGDWDAPSDDAREEKLDEDTRNGDFTNPDRAAEETIEVPQGATRITLHASGSSVVGPPEVDLVLLGPGGEEIASSGADGDFMSYPATVPGTYTVELRPATGSTTVSYDLEIVVWGYE